MIERFFNRGYEEVLKMPISIYNIYADQAINHLSASMGNKFETQIGENKKDRMRAFIKKLKQEKEYRDSMEKIDG